MPVAGTPGQQASSLYGQADTQGNELFGASQAISPTLSALYNQELTNPQGFGATTLAQMLTQGSESIAGGLGAAKQTATDIGARTGNTSAIPSIIGSADKAGISQQSNNVNNLAIQNAMEKMKQQASGAAGLSSLYGTDLSGGLSAESLADKALGTRLSANQVGHSDLSSDIGDTASILGMGMGGASSIASLFPQNVGPQIFNQLGGGLGAGNPGGAPVSLSDIPNQI